MKLILSIISLITINAFSQDSLVNYIDSTMYNYNSIINLSKEEGMDFFPPKFTIESTLMERAIGEVKTATTVYFDKHELASQNFDRPKDYGVIRKVEVSIESGSYLINKTFYFNVQGELAYYYYKEGGYECYEKSYYFNSSNCIQLTHHNLQTEDCDAAIQENYIKTKLNDSDKRRIISITNKATTYIVLLNTYYNALGF